MISKKHRFITRIGDDFFANAKRIYSPLFVLYFQQKEVAEKIEIAVIVPRKNVPKATKRSKAKRKMKKALKPLIPSLKGFKIVLYLKKKITNEDYLNFDKEIRKMSLKIK